ncbi:MAG: LuxR C-terminal-related transcriptional regulator [Longimicrobiales bacterium]|nr:LuxR C-terminal-related transcriptional regulator [Longimicrobiales bacterium]
MMYSDSVSDPGHGGGPALVLASIFLFVIVGVAVDLWLDRPETLLSVHVAVEVLIVLLSLGAAVYLARGWYASDARLAESVRESERLAEERRVWRDRASELLEPLGRAIDRQFEEWGLTPTERTVAFMVLKGLSHKRIARITNTSPRTVRQHAASVYRKSGLGGRAELAGFFLEPMLQPPSSKVGGDE